MDMDTQRGGHDPDDVADMVRHDALAMAAMFGGVAVVVSPGYGHVEDLGNVNGFGISYDRSERAYTLARGEHRYTVPRSLVGGLILALGHVERDSDRRHFTGN